MQGRRSFVVWCASCVILVRYLKTKHAFSQLLSKALLDLSHIETNESGVRNGLFNPDLNKRFCCLHAGDGFEDLNALEVLVALQLDIPIVALELTFTGHRVDRFASVLRQQVLSLGHCALQCHRLRVLQGFLLQELSLLLLCLNHVLRFACEADILCLFRHNVGQS